MYPADNLWDKSFIKLYRSWVLVNPLMYSDILFRLLFEDKIDDTNLYKSLSVSFALPKNL